MTPPERRGVTAAPYTTRVATCHDRGVDHEDVISVSAVVLIRPDGAVATVRKSGTTRFMLPGGKWERGESPRDCALRELHEELGVTLGPSGLSPLGRFVTATANEPGSTLVSEVFTAESDGDQRARAEIAEVRWVTPEELHVVSALPEDACAPWAPLLVRVAREHLVARYGSDRGELVDDHGEPAGGPLRGSAAPPA